MLLAYPKGIPVASHPPGAYSQQSLVSLIYMSIVEATPNNIAFSLKAGFDKNNT
jgi:hypothetical protein